MKLRLNLFLILLLCMTVGMFGISCTGEDGATGPPGPQGPPGPPGENASPVDIEAIISEVVNRLTPKEPDLGDCTLLAEGKKNYLGSSGDDVICGDDADNAIFAGSGDDVVFGNAGDDRIGGNEDHDTLNGGAGDDTLNGDEGDDTLNGGAGDDTLNGGEGRDVLNGGAGNDLLTGGEDSDEFNGGGGSDTVNLATPAPLFGVPVQGPLVVDLAEGAADGEDGREDTYNSIENIIGGHGADTIYGDENNNVITGGNGADTLYGRGGHDTLDGGDGADTLEGGPGNDTYVNPGNNDTITEKEDEGTDTVSYASSDSAAVVDTVPANFEGFVGSAVDDTITANNLGNVIEGGVGDDGITLGDGEDTVVYNKGDGSDTVTDFSVDEDTVILKGFSAQEQTDIAVSGSDITLDSVTLITLSGVTTLIKSDLIFQ